MSRSRSNGLSFAFITSEEKKTRTRLFSFDIALFDLFDTVVRQKEHTRREKVGNDVVQYGTLGHSRSKPVRGQREYEDETRDGEENNTGRGVVDTQLSVG